LYKKILVPLDGSKLAESALGHAEKLADAFEAEIILFQVVSLGPFYGGPEFVSFVDDAKEKEAANRYLTSLAEELKSKGFNVATKVKTGLEVAAEIKDFAKESGADLIVMCARGHSGISARSLGSVARRALAQSETPILLVHLKR
jgi:nucleotide-binding universal stress UspA family protein